MYGMLFFYCVCVLIVCVLNLSLSANIESQAIIVDTLRGLSTNDSSSSSPPQLRILILQLHRLGLANRSGLRALADWHQISLLTHRLLVVSWKVTPDCAASFDDLFASYPSSLQFLPFTIGNHETDSILQSQFISITSSLGYSSATLDGDDSTILQDPKLLVSDVDVIFANHDGVRALVGVPCQFYLSQKSSFLSSLLPQADIDNVVKDVMQTYYVDRVMVGVHIRMHDNVFDWAIIPPVSTSAGSHADSSSDASGTVPSALRFGSGASIEDFIRVMTGIRDRFAFSEDSLVRFFIASNDPNAKRRILEVYPGSIALDVISSRSSLDGVRNALIEWLLLSKSSLVLHTYASTFAPEAALVHMRPMVGLYHSQLIHHTDLRLPFCGLPLFIAAYSNAGVTGSYKEETVDSRQIDNVYLAYRPCSLLDEWGLGSSDSVYCAAIV